MSDENGIRVRPMTSGDVDKVFAIAAVLPQAPHWAREVYDAMLYPASAPRRVALVAEEGKSGRIAGFAVVKMMPPEAELESIAVVAERQRQGVAHELFEAAVSELLLADVSEILLEVRTSNSAAQALYRSLGFVVEGNRKGYYADPVEDAVLMRKRLQS